MSGIYGDKKTLWLCLAGDNSAERNIKLNPK